MMTTISHVRRKEERPIMTLFDFNKQLGTASTSVNLHPSGPTRTKLIKDDKVI
jgi:hypothetical protein